MPTTRSPEEGPKLPDPGPLVENLLAVATESIQRNSEQALGIWRQITRGDYEPKSLLRDSATFWGATTRDVAKTLTLVRRYLEEIGDEDEEAATK